MFLPPCILPCKLSKYSEKSMFCWRCAVRGSWGASTSIQYKRSSAGSQNHRRAGIHPAWKPALKFACSIPPTPVMAETEHDTLLSNDEDLKFCPHCSQPYDHRKEPYLPKTVFPLIFAFSFLLIGAAIGTLGFLVGRSAARDPSLQLYCKSFPVIAFYGRLLIVRH